MSISEREQQVRRLQEKISEDKEIDVAEEFDQLVDYLREHGYDIVKKEYPETTEEKLQEYNETLADTESPRSVKKIEEGVKEICRRAVVDPENMLHIWESQLRSAMERAKNSRRTTDFAELREYIKAGHSIAKQLQNDE